jgi:hypothetical protein
MAFPKKVYIYEQADNDGSKYLVACHSPQEWDEDGLMGIYHLHETIRTKHSIEVSPVQVKKRARR